MTNLDLVGRTLDRIIAHPEAWDQEVFANVCGTQFCFAGHALLAAGYRPTGVELMEKGGQRFDIPFQAARELRLNFYQVDEIFYFDPADELFENGEEITVASKLRLMIERVASVTGIDPAPYLEKVADLS